MGTFYDSVHIRCENVQYIIKLLNNQSLLMGNFYIVPPINGWISLYLQVDDSRIYKILSAQLQTLIVVIKLHDDDVFYYICYNNGHIIDGYESRADLFSVVPDEEKKFMVGDPSKWIDLLPFEIDINRLNEVLLLMKDNLHFADYPEEFCNLICLPNALLSYDYIFDDDEDALSQVSNLDSFIFCDHSQYIPNSDTSDKN
jgi:hypothetical protein